MRILAGDLLDWDFPRTSNKLFELALQVETSTQPATIREVRTEILGWRNDLVDEMLSPIIIDDLTGVLGQLRDLQHDLEG
jgi:hypothetical protein